MSKVRTRKALHLKTYCGKHTEEPLILHAIRRKPCKRGDHIQGAHRHSRSIKRSFGRDRAPLRRFNRSHETDEKNTSPSLVNKPTATIFVHITELYTLAVPCNTNS